MNSLGIKRSVAGSISARCLTRLGNLKNIAEFDENERSAVAGFEFYKHFECKGESRKAVGCTKKFKFIDPLTALALMGKACHWYADRQEQTGPDGGPITNNVTVTFVEPSISPEEAYRRMVQGYQPG